VYKNSGRSRHTLYGGGWTGGVCLRCSRSPTERFSALHYKVSVQEPESEVGPSLLPERTHFRPPTLVVIRVPLGLAKLHTILVTAL